MRSIFSKNEIIGSFFFKFRELGKNQTWEVITMLNDNPTIQETRQMSFKKGDFLMWLRGTLH